jgi:hypothetical protein
MQITQEIFLNECLEWVLDNLDIDIEQCVGIVNDLLKFYTDMTEPNMNDMTLLT